MVRSINSICDRIKDALLSPAKEGFVYFIILSLFTSAGEIFFWSLVGDPVFGLYMGVHNIVVCYCVSAATSFFKGTIRTIIKSLFLCFAFIDLCIDTGVHSIMGYGFTNDMVAIVMGTNTSETGEFLKMYITPGIIGFISIVLIVAITIKCVSIRMQLPNGIKACFVLLVVALGSSFLVAKQSKNWDSVYLFKLRPFLKYEPTRDLRSYRKTYRLEQKLKNRPKHIVLVIGESLTKKHMSLYGYQKVTTPCLDNLRDSSKILVFNNVKSSGVGTIQSFKYLMTSTMPNNDCGDDWYDSIYLSDVARSAGYNVNWISNQSSSGAYDNIVARFSELSDNVIWCGQKHMGIAKNDLDEVLLDSITIEDKDDLTIIHMMGSHENFSSRYSNEYERFHASDYDGSPYNQRDILSAYDNSVLYNDFVVTSIIEKYSDQEVVLFYFPDHALDVFESSSDYAGHSRLNDEVSVDAGKNIPFIVYLSKKYQDTFPEMTFRIQSAINNEFETGNIMYTIMDVMGVQFVDNNEVSNYSLFK